MHKRESQFMHGDGLCLRKLCYVPSGTLQKEKHGMPRYNEAVRQNDRPTLDVTDLGHCFPHIIHTSRGALLYGAESQSYFAVFFISSRFNPFFFHHHQSLQNTSAFPGSLKTRAFSKVLGVSPVLC